MANNNTQIAVVESAVVVSDAVKKELTELIVKLSGSQTEVVFKVTTGLLGGFTIQIGDRKIDASLRTELKLLAESLKG